jgi:hypothetical protein
VNPFRYSEPVPASELIDRDEETTLLVETAVSGNNSRILAPRRYGKTSLLNRLGEALAQEGWNAVYVDFFGVLTLADVAARVERAYALQLEGKVAAWFAGFRRRLRPSLRIGADEGVSADLELALDPAAEPPLLERLAIPKRMFERTGTRTLVVFDEFQDVLTASDRADAVIRSEIQHHGDAASYVFAGSQLGMMRSLFADKRRALYGQARALDLSPLDPTDVATYLDGRFRATNREIGDALDPLLDLTRGHPQRTMLLAHLLWERTPPGGRAGDQEWLGASEQAMLEVQDELRAIWTGLSPGQRRVLTSVAENREGIYAAGRRHGGSRGGAAKAAVDALLDSGEIHPDADARTGYRVVDPLLGGWVAAGRTTG